MINWLFENRAEKAKIILTIIPIGVIAALFYFFSYEIAMVILYLIIALGTIIYFFGSGLYLRYSYGGNFSYKKRSTKHEILSYRNESKDKQDGQLSIEVPNELEGALSYEHEEEGKLSIE